MSHHHRRLLPHRAIVLALAAAALQAACLAVAQPLTAGFLRSMQALSDGETKNLVLTIENSAGEAVMVTPEVTLPQGVVLAVAPEPVTLAAGESTAAVLSVLIPPLTPPGAYPITVRLATASGETLAATTTLQVRIRREVTLHGPSETPGPTPRARTFTLTLTNTGNTVERLTLLPTAVPNAKITVSPEAQELAPGASTEVTVGMESPLAMTGVQRLRVAALTAGGDEPLSTLDLSYVVLGSTARVRTTQRDLRFTVRLNYAPGWNLSNPGLDALRVSISGGGMLNPDGNRQLRASLSTRGLTNVAFAGAYTSDVLDVVVGDARRDYSSLGFSASGYGLTVDVRAPQFGVSLGAYMLGERDLSALAGAGAQARLQMPGLEGSLNFTYDPGLERGVLGVTTRLDPFALTPATPTAHDTTTSGPTEGHEAAAPREELTDVTSELDAATEDLPDPTSEDASESINATEDDLRQAIATAPLLQRAVISAEAGIDTVSGAAGRLQAQAGLGPATLTGRLGGATPGYRGDPLSNLTWGAGVNATLGSLGASTIGLGGEYNGIQWLDPTSGGVRNQNTIALGVGLNAEHSSLAVTYAASLRTRPDSIDTALEQAFSATARAQIDNARLGATVRWRGQDVATGSGSSGASSLEAAANLAVTLPTGAFTAEGTLQYDLMKGEVVDARAEVIAAFELDDLNDARFGVRYRYADGLQWIAALARWSGDLTPAIRADAGLTGTLYYRGDQASKSLNASVATSIAIAAGQRLGITGQARFTDTRQPAFSVSTTYSFPVSIPIARIEGLGDLTGRLHDQDGHPMAGVELRIGRAAVMTDHDGRFEVLGLRTGDYTLLATAGLDWRLTQPALPTTVTIQDRSTTRLDILVTPAGSVTGNVNLVTPEASPGVMFGSGNPAEDAATISNLTVRLTSSDHRTYEATSSTRGRLTFPALPPGVYQVSIPTDLGGLYRVEATTPQVMVTATHSTELEIQIHPLPRVIEMQPVGAADQGNKR